MIHGMNDGTQNQNAGDDGQPVAKIVMPMMVMTIFPLVVHAVIEMAAITVVIAIMTTREPAVLITL